MAFQLTVTVALWVAADPQSRMGTPVVGCSTGRWCWSPLDHINMKLKQRNDIKARHNSRMTKIAS